MKFARILYNDEIYYAKYDSSSNMFELIEGDIFDFFSYTSTNVNRNEVKILPTCEPSKIVAVGLNYANHANEMGLNIPKFPALFLKPSSSVIGNMDNIIYPDMSEQVDDNGELVFGESHILCNLFNIDAIERMGNKPLPYHTAFKKATYIDKDGNKVVPDGPNAYKFEAFLFDAFGELDDMAILRVKREEEFAPVKNATGTDSPETARELYRKFYNLK